MSRPHHLKSDRGHSYNLFTPTTRTNHCVIIQKPTHEGYTMGGLGLGFMEEKEGTVNHPHDSYVGGMRLKESHLFYNYLIS